MALVGVSLASGSGWGVVRGGLVGLLALVRLRSREPFRSGRTRSARGGHCMTTVVAGQVTTERTRASASSIWSGVVAQFVTSRSRPGPMR